MIASIAVWHGPTYAMYGNDARERITSPWPVIIDCDQISPNSLADHLPEESILTPERNDLWLRGTHHWKADELAKALTFIAKHPMDLDVIVTSDTAPTKALNDAIGATERSEVHDFQVPKDAAAYAKQLRQWLDRRERLLDTTTAKRLISACESKPAAAQGIAVTLAQTPVTRSIDWDLIKPLVDAAVADTRPVWELGQTLLTGDAHETLATMDRIDAEPFAVLRYLENRYRMMTLSASGLNADAICAHLPDANRWAVTKTVTETKKHRITTDVTILALRTIATAFDLLHNSPASMAHTIMENAVLRLARHHRVLAS